MGNYFIINISASIMIVITFLIRKLMKNRIPHMVFTLLWLAIGIRLLVPMTIETPISFYNWKSAIQNETNIESVANDNVEITQANMQVEMSAEVHRFNINWQSLWVIGCLVVGFYFIVQYINTRKEVNGATTLLENEWIDNRIKQQHLLFHVECRINEKVSSPAVWGSFTPILLFPSNFDFSNQNNVEYIILHECGHIKYFHSLLKIISMLIVTLYWYNPFVWILYLYIDRDMEISADRYVLKQMSNDQRANYAMSLVNAASAKKRVPIFYYHYKKNFIKERIEAIMNFKKLTVGAVITAMLVPMSVVSVFATTDIILTDRDLQSMDIEVIEVEIDETPTAEDTYLELEWEEIEEYVSEGKVRATAYYNVTDYKHVTYGKIPPKTISVTIDKSGKTYAGTLTRGNYVYDSKNDKYTGYYSGKVYLQ